MVHVAKNKICNHKDPENLKRAKSKHLLAFISSSFVAASQVSKNTLWFIVLKMRNKDVELHEKNYYDKICFKVTT